jgi:hypothetical protein
MYISISQEISRQHREEIMNAITSTRLETPRGYSDATSRLVRNLRWEFARYAGLIGKRVRQ